MTTPTFETLRTGPVGQQFPSGVLRRAEVQQTGITLTFDDASVVVLPDWLRDNCPCDVCRIRQTDERRWQPWNDSNPASVERLVVTDESLEITWTSGHTSTFAATAFERIRRASQRGIWTTHLWRQGYDVSRFEHDAVIHTEDARRAFLEAFRRDGVAVVTHSPTVPGSVITFLESIGITLRDSSLGLIFDVKLNPAGYNVAFTRELVPPHNDNAQYTNPPSGQVLAMLVNDATGGESIVVDGFAVLTALERVDPQAIDVLCRVAVGFRQYSPDADAFTRQPLVERDREGRFTHLRFSNQLMQPLPFDDPDLGEWYRAYRLLGSALSDPANQVSFKLGAGESLIVNNHRVLHARAEFTPDGPRHLQDVYFDADDVCSLLDRMTGQALNEMVMS